jgi:hypothetical protein
MPAEKTLPAIATAFNVMARYKSFSTTVSHGMPEARSAHSSAVTWLLRASCCCRQAHILLLSMFEQCDWLQDATAGINTSPTAMQHAPFLSEQLHTAAYLLVLAVEQQES